MYHCTDCGKFFEDYIEEREYNGLEAPPFERVAVCPFCFSTAVESVTIRRCALCGAPLREGQSDYCTEDCRRRAVRLRREEQHRKRPALNSLTAVLRELAEYNRLHSTVYTYGQYISKIRPWLKKGKDGKICLV